MFALISAGEKQGFIREKMWKNKFEICEKSFWGYRYYHFQAKTDNIPWDKIMEKCPKKMPVLLGRGVERIEGLNVFSGDKLYRKLFADRFLEILKNMDNPSLAVVDYDCSLVSMISTYLRHAKSVRVITDKAEKYTGYSADILRETGASILVSSDINSARNDSVLFAPKGIRSGGIFGDETMIYTISANGIHAQNVFVPVSVNIPERFRNEIPVDVEPFYFLSALYQLCEMKNVTNIKLDIRRKI